jgi:putative flippase GtrA
MQPAAAASPAPIDAAGKADFQYLRFLATGGFAAAVNVTSRFVLNPILGFETAVLSAYLIGMVTAYLLFRAFVFGRSGRSISSEVYRFTLVNLGALAIVWLVSVALARAVFPAIGLVWHAQDIAHLIGVSIPAITSYFGHLLYTFRKMPAA